MTEKLLYKELSFKIVGILFEVHNQLGSYYHEKYYQRAIESLLLEKNIPFGKEQKVDIIINNKKIGKHFADFIIDSKIILEIKKGNIIRIGDVRQVLMYLKTSGLKVGILAYFGTDGVIFKRIINSDKTVRENLRKFA